MLYFILLLTMFMSWTSKISYFMFFGVTLVWVVLNMFNSLFKSSFFLVKLMWLMMVMFFFTNMIWILYIFFEINMVPMVLILMGWGMNMSRINAAIYMMLYTSFFSLPVLMIIITNLKLLFVLSFFLMNYYLNLFSKLALIFMFMVKIPIFGLHYWLPKAHVEASTIGSMILASGLLKMGGLGFIKMILWLNLFINNSWLILGGALGAWFCCFQVDQKKMVALSSVSHMSLAAAGLMTNLKIGLWSMVFYSFTHSITSSAMFYMAGLTANSSKTRLLPFMSFYYLFLTMLLISVVLINLGIPPSVSFISELISITSLFCKNFLTSFLVFMMIISTLMFSMIYIFSFYNSKIKFFTLMISSSSLVLMFHLIFLILWFYKGS